MKSTLEPLTVGYDWEMAVLTKTGENADQRDVESVADEMRSRIAWAQTGTDMELLESRIGAISSFDELLTKSEAFESQLRKVLRTRGYLLFRAGARPFEREPIGSHIHVGSLCDWASAVRIQNAMVPYVAPLAALTANSPVYRSRSGLYKSYRVASFAESCSRPQQVVVPELSQPSWGEDVCVRLAWGPTVELRACDGASSTRLMCEVAVLTAGLMYHLSRHTDRSGDGVSRDAFLAAMTNRWRASKYGLQAKFIHDGVDGVPAERLLTDAVEMAQDGMKLMGATSDDLVLVREMLKKRQTQADFQLAVFARERGDAHRLQLALANIQRDPRAFETYLKKAPALPILEPAPYQDELLSFVEIETPYSDILRASPLGPAQLSAMLSRLVSEGRLESGRDERQERIYTRCELADVLHTGSTRIRLRDDRSS